MKKIIICVLSFALVLNMFGCSKKNSELTSNLDEH